MEEYKRRYRNYILNRNVQNQLEEEPLNRNGEHCLVQRKKAVNQLEEEPLNRNGARSLKQCKEAVNQLEAEARRCYSEKVELDSSTFVEMMVLDGLFIIELFRRAEERKEAKNAKTTARKAEYPHDQNPGARKAEYPSNQNPRARKADPILDLGWLRRTISVDLLMLENQIPLRILKSLSSVVGINEDSLINSFCLFFSFNLPDTNPEFLRGSKHLLHLFHRCHRIPPKNDRSVHCLHLPSPEEGKEPRLEVVPTASKLHEAGIQFQKELEVHKINFCGGVLKIPPLLTQGAMISVFFNLAAFEQCYPYCDPYFSGYIYFMDYLINNAKDVEILCENGIIDPWLSNYEELAAIFNKMGKEVTVDYLDYHLRNVCKQIKDYCRARRHNWRAILMRNHCNNPWTITALVAASVILILTIMQTFFTAFPKFADEN